MNNIASAVWILACTLCVTCLSDRVWADYDLGTSAVSVSGDAQMPGCTSKDTSLVFNVGLVAIGSKQGARVPFTVLCDVPLTVTYDVEWVDAGSGSKGVYTFSDNHDQVAMELCFAYGSSYCLNLPYSSRLKSNTDKWDLQLTYIPKSVGAFKRTGTLHISYE